MTIEEVLIGFSVMVSIQMVAIGIVFFLLHKRKVWPLIRLGISGHGSLAEKFLPDNGVEFIYSPKAIRRVPWKLRDRASGKLNQFFQPIDRAFHHLANSSIALHICPYNTTSSISILDRESKGLTSQEENDAIKYAYFEGVIDTRRAMVKPGMPNIPIKAIIFAGGMVLVLVLAWPMIAPMFGMK